MNLESGAVYSDKLAIFSKQLADVSVLKREWVNIQPTTEWGKGSTINFEVRGETNAYIDLKSTKLRATIQIVDSKGAPIAADASDGIVNQILYSTCMLSQVDLTLQHTTMKSLGPYYAYKAIIDKILNSSIDDDNRKDCLSMYIKDRGENIGSTDFSTLDNISLRIREASTRGDQLLDLMGDLQLDCNYTQFKGVSSIPFVLIKATSRLVVTLTYLLAKYHTKYICVWLQLKHTMVQEIRTPSTFNILMLIIIIAYLLNNTCIPNQPLKPNFKTKNYVDCYSTLFRGGKSSNVSYEEFSKGAAIFEIDIAAELENSNVQSMKQAGEGCIELRFEEALADNITVIIYGTFRGNVEISGSGEVS